MTLSRFLIVIVLVVFSAIGVAALLKEKPTEKKAIVKAVPKQPAKAPIVVKLPEPTKSVSPAPIPAAPSTVAIAPPTVPAAAATPIAATTPAPLPSSFDLPDANRIEELFNKVGQGPQFPIVETITYKSRVGWQKGRPAWLSDYASHYETSRHFIARSLNGTADYNKQEIKEGDRFNVLRKDRNYRFHLVVDTSRCKLWFYYVDLDEKKNVLIKTYQVGLGRLDSSKASGLLTPLGTYTLGNKIMVYKPKMMGTHQGKKTEMMLVFGTRWIPFDSEIGTCTAPAKGFGIHGAPWEYTENKKEPVEITGSLGKYESDGCLRLSTADIEELYAIIVTKPAQIEIVRDFHDSTVAGE